MRVSCQAPSAGASCSGCNQRWQADALASNLSQNGRLEPLGSGRDAPYLLAKTTHHKGFSSIHKRHHLHGLRQRGVPSNGVRFWLFLHPPSLAVIPAPLVRCFHSAAACSTWRAPSEAPFQASCSTSNPCLQLKPADWMPCSMQPSGGVGGLGVGLQPTSRHVLVSVFQWKHNSSDLLAVLYERVRHGEVPPVRGSCHTGFPTFGGWTLRPRNRDQARPAGEVSGTFIVLVLTFLFRLISALLFLWSFVGALCRQELYRGPETGWGTLHTLLGVLGRADSRGTGSSQHAWTQQKGWACLE